MAAPAPARSDKPAMETKPRKPRQPTRPPTDYDDEITPEQIAALNRIVPDDEFNDYKTISGPAW
jgi:hypothetical protein